MKLKSTISITQLGDTADGISSHDVEIFNSNMNSQTRKKGQVGTIKLIFSQLFSKQLIIENDYVVQ